MLVRRAVASPLLLVGAVVAGESALIDTADANVQDREEGGVTAVFSFDRMTVQRFRLAFPRARWNDQSKAWVVPGKTARRRIDRWLAMEQTRADPYAEAKGRDAYAFEPILSAYLIVDRDGFRIKTPYSRALVEEIRQIPFARWDSDDKVWRVPFASYDDLLGHWQAIEAEARRCEPEERRKRAEARKGTEEERRARRRAAERRRRRIPLPAHDLPPLERPVATEAYGIVIVFEITGELVDRDGLADLYRNLHADHVWGSWRVPSLDELVRTWPAKSDPDDGERARGWWLPTLDELREARRTARSRERRMATDTPA